MRAVLAAGTVVVVGPAYRMGGFYVPDGWEGTYTVIRRLPDSRVGMSSDDYYLARGIVPVEGAEWDVIVNRSRLTEKAKAVLSTIRVLFRAPDSLALWGIPYEMNREVRQQPMDLFRAHGGALPGWIYLGSPGWWGAMTRDEQAEVTAFLAGRDVPCNPCEWDTIPTRCE